MQIRTILIYLITLFVITSCSSYDFSKQVVQQGNLLPHAKIERLNIGMSKNDAAFILGTSLLSPTFNNDRWDYAYTLRKRGGNIAVRNLILYFKNDKLSKIEHN